MNWAAYSTLFGLATFKFMFSAFPGPLWNISFVETYICIFFGGTLSASVFYFASDYFILMTGKRIMKKRDKLRAAGKEIQEKPKFTKTNKFIVWCKMKFGMHVICFWAPFFLSVPLGSIVVAKFYGKMKYTFIYVALGMAMNSLIMTFLAYVVF
jgi:hypothetical protein